MQQDRQILHWGRERQRRLENATIGIYGGNILAEYLGAGLAALGVGGIAPLGNRVYQGSNSLLLGGMRKGESIAHGLAHVLKQIWPGGNYYPIHSPLEAELLRGVSLDALVSTREKEECARVARELRIPFFSLRTPSRNPVYNCCYTGVLLHHLCAYLFGDSHRKSIETKLLGQPISGGSYLVVGCGALGNPVGSLLTLAGARRVDLVDFDTIELTNLNRQFLLYGRIGEHKASVLRERLKKMNPQLQSRVHLEPFSPKQLIPYRNNRYDCIFSCVDSIPARIQLSDSAKRYGIPLVNGGTSAVAGAVQSYVPRKTLSIREQCALDLIREERSQSCIQATPSVIIPNLVIGALMVHSWSRVQKREQPKSYSYDLGNIHSF